VSASAMSEGRGGGDFTLGLDMLSASGWVRLGLGVGDNAVDGGERLVRVRENGWNLGTVVVSGVDDSVLAGARSMGTGTPTG
jgi:hypothetical protein